MNTTLLPLAIEVLESRIAPAAFTVTTLKDITDTLHDTGSLRDAIFNANASLDLGGTNSITFNVHGKILLGSDLPGISLQLGQSLSITGPVANKSTGIVIDGHKQHAIFNITAGTVSLTDLTVTHGLSGIGGGLYIDDTSPVTLTDLTISGNHASASTGDVKGGGIAVIGGGTSVSISNSKIIGNTATGVTGWAGGGAIYTTGTLDIMESLISGNKAQGLNGTAGGNGLGAYAGGIYVSSGTTTIEHGTFTKNSALGGNGGANTAQGGAGGAGARASGGGVYNWNGSLTVQDSVISGNLAKAGKGGKGGKGGDGGDGGGAYGGGAYENHGLTIETSSLVSNRVVAGGAGAKGAGGHNGAAGASWGGGAYSEHGIDLTEVTISKNTAGHGGGVWVHGTTSNITGCTVSQNHAAISGGGLYLGGTGAITIQDSTVALNKSAGDGGGVYITGGTVKIHNSTIAQNSANAAKGTGGGVELFGGTTSVEIISSIIAGNKGHTDADMSSTAADATVSYTLIQQVTAGTLFTDNGKNITGKNPLLGALANNGGATLTMLPKANSPVVDQGINSDSLTLDQRGTGFPRTVDNPSVTNAAGGDGTDMGAVELA